MTNSKQGNITLSAGPSLKTASQDVTQMANFHLDDQLFTDSSARACDLVMLALALADEDMSWAHWLDECWMRACRQQQATINELREDPHWVLIAVGRGESVGRFGWRIAGYRRETAFMEKPLWLLSDAERGVLLGWRIALPPDHVVTLREALNSMGRALGAILTDEPEPTGADSVEEIFQALSVRAAARQAQVRED